MLRRLCAAAVSSYGAPAAHAGEVDPTEEGLKSVSRCKRRSFVMSGRAIVVLLEIFECDVERAIAAGRGR